MKLPAPVRKLLRTRIVWTLSGLTYPTAAYATKGRLLTQSQYLGICRDDMSRLAKHLPPHATILEFGCGLGGHLIAVDGSVDLGVGVDINRFFVRLARKMAFHAGAFHLRFVSYDGARVPIIPGGVDVALAIGVFERIPRSLALNYLDQLSEQLKPGGRLLIHLLTERAHETTLFDRLGSEAYTPWSPSDMNDWLERSDMLVEEVIPWGFRPRSDGSGLSTVAEIHVLAKPDGS
ncbi:MAG: class I SAM-dependent methyltransferase [Thermoplasmata archaeon]|nr:class I SAM-dependent methyltransferase [Thermoplasmata archaeon]